MSQRSSAGRVARGQPYRGEDRRRNARSTDVPRHGLLFGALGLVAISLLAFLPGDGDIAGQIDAPLLNALMEGSAATLALSIALLGMVRWRLIGDALSLRTSIGLISYGLAGLALGTLGPLVAPQFAGAAAWLRFGGVAGLLLMTGWGLAGPPVDAALRPWKVIGALVATAIGIGVVAASVVAAHGSTAVSAAPVVTQWLAIGFFPVVAALVARSGRVGQPTLAWFGLAISALTLAELLPLATADTTLLVVHPATALRLLGLGFAFAASRLELEQAYEQQSRRLLDSLVDLETVQAWERAEQEAQERRAHDAFNALTAIDGVTRTIERYRDRIEPGLRDELTASVSREMVRLQKLIGAEQLADRAAVYCLDEALRPAVDEARAAGLQVEVSRASGAFAYGQAEAARQIIGILLDVVAESAPLVRITVGGDEARTTLRFVPTARVARRAVAGEGSGLGLFVASQLASGQGGAMWTAMEHGRQVVVLELLRASSVAAEAPDQAVDPRDVAEVDELLRHGAAEHDRSRARPVREPDRHVRRQPLRERS